MLTLVYYETQEEKIHQVLSRRLKDKFDIFGSHPGKKLMTYSTPVQGDHRPGQKPLEAWLAGLVGKDLIERLSELW